MIFHERVLISHQWTLSPKADGFLQSGTVGRIIIDHVLLFTLQWFGFYKPGQSKELYTLQESPLYQEVCIMDMHHFVISHFLPDIAPGVGLC